LSLKNESGGISALSKEITESDWTVPDDWARAKLAGEARSGTVEGPEAAVWVALARTLLNLDEFVTRE
jgi:hypothetical protein